jgi:hypothetical protein
LGVLGVDVDVGRIGRITTDKPRNILTGRISYRAGLAGFVNDIPTTKDQKSAHFLRLPCNSVQNRAPSVDSP